MKVTTTIASLALLAGCQTVPSAQSDDQSADKPKLKSATYATIGPCTSDAESVLFTTIFSSAIAVGVDRVGKAIAAAAAGKTEITLSDRMTAMKSLSQGEDAACLIVVRGNFFTDYPIDPATNKPSTLAKMSSVFEASFKPTHEGFRYNANPSAHRTLIKAGLPIAETPDFYFEAQIDCIEHTDCELGTLRPRFAYMGRPSGTKKFKKDQTRQVLISFALTDLAKRSDLKKGGGATLKVGELKSGNWRTFSNTEFMPNADICLKSAGGKSCDPNDPDIRVYSPDASEVFALPKAGKRELKRLQVLVSETKKKDEFLGFIAEVFGKSAETITKELQTSLVPDLALAADEEEKAADEKLKNEFDKAFADADKALSDCIATPTKANAAKVRGALRLLNKAARNLPDGAVGKVAEFYNEELIPYNKDSTATASACQSAYDQSFK